MRQGIIRWTIYLLCLMVIGPIAGSMTGALRAVDGGPGATPLVSANPTAGMLAALVAIGLAFAVGAFTARLLGVAPGMTSAGLVLAWATWRTGTVDDLIRTAHSGGPFTRLALEGLIFGVVGAVITAVLWAIGRRHQEPGHRADLNEPAARALGRFFSAKAGLAALAVAVIAGGVGAWFIGVTPLKGQALAAAIAAATLAAAAGRLVEFTAPIPALFLAVAALAVLGPLSGIATVGTGVGAVQEAYRGSLFPLAVICPLDWIAGGLLGIPMGVAWAGSMIEKRAE